MQKAVLDIGSNTIRLLIADISSQHIQRIHYEHHIARLGEGLQQTGRLGQAGIQRAIKAFDHIIAACAKHGIQPRQIHAVATAAVREACNGSAFVKQVQAETGLSIQIIDGQTEAKLALAGAKLGLGKRIADNMLLFDIGGGSTEFNRVIGGKLEDSFSLKIGVVRLMEQYQDYSDLKQAVIPFLTRLDQRWQHAAPPTHLVGTAGTVTTLAAITQNMQHYDAKAINGYALPQATFQAVKQQLLSMTPHQRLQHYRILEKGREDVIIAGVAMIDAIFEHWHYHTLISVDYGLLEGLLLQNNS